MEEMSLRNYAYLGDVVWELFVREQTVRMTSNAKLLHKLTTERVNCATQAKLLEMIKVELSEEEVEIAKRARNLPIPIGRRHVQNEYRASTALEALIGWWYVNDKERLNKFLEILKKNVDEINSADIMKR